MKTSAGTRSQHKRRREHRPTPNVDQILDDSFPASDPPSWTGSISRVASTPERQLGNERLVRRIRAEFPRDARIVSHDRAGATPLVSGAAHV